jgi:LacI family transcriptional regulator
MKREDYAPFALVELPIIVLDSYFDSVKMDCILINNFEGAYNATNYLIRKRRAQPGYLQSAVSIHNMEERTDGYYKAIRRNGMSVSKSIVHSLSPYIDGAYADMVAIIKQGDEIANCYFADNDDIAIGAMKALKDNGYNIPTDVAIIGFDNTPFSTYTEPPLTTVNVPKSYLGELAAKRMLSILGTAEYHPIRIDVKTNLIVRNSV